MTRILFTTPAGSIREAYFTPRTLARLEALGDVVWNELGHDFSEQELAEHLPDIDICLTHWGVPAFTAGVLDQAPRLRLIAHAAGTVADLATPLVFERGIRISSANRIMARYVAEGLLACVLAGLRRLPQQMNMVQTHGWHRQEPNLGSLYEAKIGLIGLGAVGR